MLDGGADPNATDRATGTHVLMLAALQNDRWLAEQLIRRGADPSLEEVGKGRKPLTLTLILTLITNPNPN